MRLTGRWPFSSACGPTIFSSDGLPVTTLEFSKYSPGLMQIRLMAEALGTVGVWKSFDMGKGARRYTDALRNSDIYVGEGAVTSHSMSGAAYRLRDAASLYALRTVGGHPGLHRAADLVLRRSGVSSRTYGRGLLKGERSTAMGRIHGWPAILTEPDLLESPLTLQPLRFSDAPRVAPDAGMRTPCGSARGMPPVPRHPQPSRGSEGYIGLARQTPIWPYV